MTIFSEVALLLSLALSVSVLMHFLRQPLIVGYILTGILAGPFAFNLLRSSHELELFSQIGIVFLLFIVGLHLNPNVIREVGKVSLVTGLGQILFTSLVGFVLTLLLGIDRLAALYVAIALTFSSTIIILKLVSDKGDLEKLYAKIAIGFLLVQDIVATLILISVAVFAGDTSGQLGLTLLYTLVKGVFILIALLTFTHFLIQRVSKFLAQSQELLFLFSTAWALGLAALMDAAGFSLEIGALVAGVTLAITPYSEEMASRLKPIRDLFILIFFILLGSQMELSNLQSLVIPALALSAFVLIGNPIIIIILMNLLGYSRQTGFKAGLAVAQISEFSLILATLGFQIGHISQPVLSLITLVGLITIAGSTYLILYADSLYPKLTGLLSFFEIVKNRPLESERDQARAQIILFGYDRVGRDFVKTFKSMKKPFLVVDFNPESIKKLEDNGLPHLFGDASDSEFLSSLPLDQAKLVISTIPDQTTNLLIQKHLNQVNPATLTLLLASTIPDAQALYHHGSSYVIMPHFLGAQYAARLIGRYGFRGYMYNKKREQHQHFLASRN